MTQFTFAPATKAQAKARIALAGPSGSGKTYTGLITARALGDRVAVIDTERGSASKYADVFAFDTLTMTTFDPRDLVKALAAAGAAGYDVVMVDSLSHYWMGTAGMLEQVDHAARRSGGGNTFAGWKEARPMERAMVDGLLAYPGHVIVTMRTKTEWVIDENERGKKVPRKLGTKPEQRDGIEYEFDIVADLDLEYTLVVSKTRCRDLAGAVIRRTDEQFGKTIRAWLEDGTPVAMVTAEQHRHMRALWAELGFAGDDSRDRRLEVTSKLVGRTVTSSASLTEAEAEAVVAALVERKAKQVTQ